MVESRREMFKFRGSTVTDISSKFRDTMRDSLNSTLLSIRAVTLKQAKSTSEEKDSDEFDRR